MNSFFFFNKAWLSYGFQTENSVRLNCMKLCFYLQNQWFHMVQPNVEKAMAPHSSTLAWKIPWTEEPGGLPSMGSLRVGHDWATSLSLFTFMHWRRKWQPTPAFLPGESQEQGGLVGCRLWGRTGSDTTDATSQQQQQQQPNMCACVWAGFCVCLCVCT